MRFCKFTTTGGDEVWINPTVVDSVTAAMCAPGSTFIGNIAPFEPGAAPGWRVKGTVEEVLDRLTYGPFYGDRPGGA